MTTHVMLRVRLSQKDIHYAEGICSAAKVMELFSDAATELLIRMDNDEGLFRAYESVDYLEPLKSGDFLEVSATLLEKGITSRKIDFKAFKVIESNFDPKHPSKARTIDPPVLVAQAVGTCVVPKK